MYVTIIGDGCELNIVRTSQKGHISIQDQCTCRNNINNTCGQIQPGDDNN